MNVLALLLASSITTTPFVKGPYLQRLGSNSVEVRVELAAPANASLDLETEGRPERTVTDGLSADFHSFLVTDLRPSTAYSYHVVSGNSATDLGHFVTAPPEGAKDSFAFVLYGDNRTDGPAHAAVVRAIQKESFDFLVHTGDAVQQGGRGPLWQDFFDIERTLLRDHCVFACVGNHELFDDNEAAHFERYFGPTVDGRSPKLYGSFRWASARFFLLNAFQDWSEGEERTWLEHALKDADREPDLRWRIAVIHHSPWSAGPHGNNAPLLAAGIADLLVAHHVELVLAGHDHIYERGESSGLKYVISGGGGAPLYKDVSPKASTRKVESTFNFVRFDVTSERMALVAKRAEGSTIEECSFGHGESWACGDAPTTSVAASTPTPAAAPVPPESARPAPTAAARCGCRLPGSSGEEGGWAGALAVLGTATLGRRARRRSAARR